MNGTEIKLPSKIKIKTNIFLCTKTKANNFKQVINANTTRGSDLLNAAYLHLRPKTKFVSDFNIF